MDNLLEIIVPLIFFAIYFFGNLFAKKGGGEEGSGSQRSSPQKGGDPEAEARQRQIQEEIRRKIMERRGQSSGEATPPPLMPAAELSQHRDEKVAQSEELPPYLNPTRDSVKPKKKVETGAFSWDSSGNAYQNAMQDRIKAIEATKRRATALKEQAANASKAVSGLNKKKSSPSRAGVFTGPVRETLRDPNAARVAFIYGEVIGQPVSLRKGSSVPGLN